MNQTPFSCSVLMCHAPIVIPEIAESRASLCTASTEAMRRAAALFVEDGAGLVVVLSPHTPRYRTAYGVVEGPELWGDFQAFGRPDLTASFPSDRHIQVDLVEAAHRRGLEVKPVPSGPLDHGALVPLHFLKEAGYAGKVVVVGFPYDTSATGNQAMGHAIHEVAVAHGGRWGLLASGDMSHRLKPGAPAGFHPQASRFDRLVVKCVDAGEYHQAGLIDAELRETAAEDVVDSLEVADACLRGCSDGRRVLSYEGPFGVGYLVAVLCHTMPPSPPPTGVTDAAGRGTP